MNIQPYATDNFAYIIEQRKAKHAARVDAILAKATALREFDQAFVKFGTMIACLGVVLLVCGLGGCLAMILAGRR